MSGKPLDAERDVAATEAPTSDLRTGTESSETLDAAFELLADPVRREAVDRLHRFGDERVTLPTLATAVASAVTADDGSPSDPRSVALDLHHVHLPMLESHGVVAYDPERGTVRYRERAWLTEWLDHVRGVEGR